MGEIVLFRSWDRVSKWVEVGADGGCTWGGEDPLAGDGEGGGG